MSTPTDAPDARGRLGSEATIPLRPRRAGLGELLITDDYSSANFVSVMNLALMIYRSAQAALAAAAPPDSGLHIVCTSLQTMAQVYTCDSYHTSFILIYYMLSKCSYEDYHCTYTTCGADDGGRARRRITYH